MAAMVVSLCLTLVGLVGCNGDSDATPPPATATPSASTPSAPSPTPSRPAPPTLPPSAKGLTVASADAFNRFYLQLLDYAEVTGDVALARRWSDKGCIGCKELLDDYSRIFASGGSVTGDSEFMNVVTTGVRLNKVKAAEVRFRATIGRHTVIEKRGAKPIIYPGEEIRWTMTLAARGGQWIMFEIADDAG